MAAFIVVRLAPLFFSLLLLVMLVSGNRHRRGCI